MAEKYTKTIELNLDAAKAQSDLSRINITINQINNNIVKTAKDINETAKETEKSVNKIQKAFGEVGKTLKETLVKSVESFVKDIVNAVKEISNYQTGAATFSTGTSLITNTSAREQQLKYGLSSAENYGFTQAKNLLGIDSEEDLMYMNANQRERLLAYMEKYSQWYSKMEQSGVLQDIQEMQLEFSMFKTDLARDFLSWVASNKDVIMTCIKGIFEFIKIIVNMVAGIMSLFGQSYDSVVTSDAYNSNAYNNDYSRINNVSISANVTNNGTGDANASSQDKMWSDLAKQIVTSTE